MSNPNGNGNPSPTIKEDAKAIRAQLDTYVQPRGGLTKVVANQSHLWEELYNGGLVSEQPRVLIICTGETARGEYAGGQKTKLHRVDRNWQVVIMRGHGFKNMMTDGRGQPGTPGAIEDFYDVCETIRDGCRAMSNITAEDVVNYKGMRPLANIGPTPVANVFLDCMVMEFDCAADIPEVLVNGTTG